MEQGPSGAPGDGITLPALPEQALALVWAQLNSKDKLAMLRSSKAVRTSIAPHITCLSMAITRSERESRAGARMRRLPPGTRLQSLRVIKKGKVKVGKGAGMEAGWEQSLAAFLEAGAKAVGEGQPVPWTDIRHLEVEGYHLAGTAAPFIGLAAPRLTHLTLSRGLLSNSTMVGLLSVRTLTHLTLNSVVLVTMLSSLDAAGSNANPGAAGAAGGVLNPAGAQPNQLQVGGAGMIGGGGGGAAGAPNVVAGMWGAAAAAAAAGNMQGALHAVAAALALGQGQGGVGGGNQGGGGGGAAAALHAALQGAQQLLQNDAHPNQQQQQNQGQNQQQLHPVVGQCLRVLSGLPALTSLALINMSLPTRTQTLEPLTQLTRLALIDCTLDDHSWVSVMKTAAVLPRLRSLQVEWGKGVASEVVPGAATETLAAGCSTLTALDLGPGTDVGADATLQLIGMPCLTSLRARDLHVAGSSPSSRQAAPTTPGARPAPVIAPEVAAAQTAAAAAAMRALPCAWRRLQLGSPSLGSLGSLPLHSLTYPLAIGPIRVEGTQLDAAERAASALADHWALVAATPVAPHPPSTPSDPGAAFLDPRLFPLDAPAPRTPSSLFSPGPAASSSSQISTTAGSSAPPQLSQLPGRLELDLSSPESDPYPTAAELLAGLLTTSHAARGVVATLSASATTLESAVSSVEILLGAHVNPATLQIVRAALQPLQDLVASRALTRVESTLSCAAEVLMHVGRPAGRWGAQLRALGPLSGHLTSLHLRNGVLGGEEGWSLGMALGVGVGGIHADGTQGHSALTELTLTECMVQSSAWPVLLRRLPRLTRITLGRMCLGDVKEADITMLAVMAAQAVAARRKPISTDFSSALGALFGAGSGAAFAAFGTATVPQGGIWVVGGQGAAGSEPQAAMAGLVQQDVQDAGPSGLTTGAGTGTQGGVQGGDVAGPSGIGAPSASAGPGAGAGPAGSHQSDMGHAAVGQLAHGPGEEQLNPGAGKGAVAGAGVGTASDAAQLGGRQATGAAAGPSIPALQQAMVPQADTSVQAGAPAFVLGAGPSGLMPAASALALQPTSRARSSVNSVERDTRPHLELLVHPSVLAPSDVGRVQARVGMWGVGEPWWRCVTVRTLPVP